jgi:hypothetical protein
MRRPYLLWFTVFALGWAVGWAAAHAAPAEPLSWRDYASLVRRLRVEARGVGDVARALEGVTLDATKAYYLHRSLQGRLRSQEAQVALADALVRAWSPRGERAREELLLAYMHLHAAATDRAITPRELASAVRSLERGGVRGATAAVAAASRAPLFAVAVQAGRRESTDQALDVELVEQILAGHLPGREPPRFVDADGDGRLSGADQVEQGGRRVPLGRGLARRILLQVGMVLATRGLVDENGAVRLEFSLLPQTHFDDRYFRPDGRSVILRAGVRASQALDALYRDAEAYGMAGATAISVIHYQAIRWAYHHVTGSDELFDRQFRDMRIGQLGMGTENDLRAARENVGGEIQIGDHGYFSTPDVDPVARLGGWNGENVIHLGGDAYFGHPFGISDARTIVSHLEAVRRRDLLNPRPAILQPTQIRLDPAALRWGD